MTGGRLKSPAPDTLGKPPLQPLIKLPRHQLYSRRTVVLQGSRHLEYLSQYSYINLCKCTKAVPENGSNPAESSERPRILRPPLIISFFTTSCCRPRQTSYLRPKYLCLRRAPPNQKHSSSQDWTSRICIILYPSRDLRLGHLGRLFMCVPMANHS